MAYAAAFADTVAVFSPPPQAALLFSHIFASGAAATARSHFAFAALTCFAASISRQSAAAIFTPPFRRLQPPSLSRFAADFFAADFRHFAQSRRRFRFT